MSDHSRSWRCELGDEARERQEEQGGRHEVDQEDPDADGLPPTAQEPGEGIRCRESEHERDQHDCSSDDRGVLEPLAVVRLLEEEPEVAQRRRVGVELERNLLDVVEVVVRPEGGHEHPVEREREDDRERRDDQPADEGLAPRGPHVTSTLRAKLSMRMATSASAGSR